MREDLEMEEDLVKLRCVVADRVLIDRSDIVVSTIIGSDRGYVDGDCDVARFGSPTGICIDKRGLYMSLILSIIVSGK